MANNHKIIIQKQMDKWSHNNNNYDNLNKLFQIIKSCGYIPKSSELSTIWCYRITCDTYKIKLESYPNTYRVKISCSSFPNKNKIRCLLHSNDKFSYKFNDEFIDVGMFSNDIFKKIIKSAINDKLSQNDIYNLIKNKYN